MLSVAMGMDCPARAEQEVPKELGHRHRRNAWSKGAARCPFCGSAFGKQVKLRDYFVSGRPVIALLAYYSCPTLCSLVLNGLVDGASVPFVPGRDYQVVTLSIDPRRKDKASPLPSVMPTCRALTESLQTSRHDWPFLTGSEQDIAKGRAGGHFSLSLGRRRKQVGPCRRNRLRAATPMVGCRRFCTESCLRIAICGSHSWEASLGESAVRWIGCFCGAFATTPKIGSTDCVHRAGPSRRRPHDDGLGSVPYCRVAKRSPRSR